MKKPTAFGKYFLLERINIGGMAEVFRAKAFGVEGFERLVAVKRILANVAEDKEFIRMFIEEAKLSVQLNHANIAQIFDLGVVDGSYYIALEHVHGRDLRGIFDRCRQLGEAMPVAQACFVAMKVCEGLDYAHNKRDQAGRELSLVHRDVSPQNILVSFEGEVKLIDFGIAKAAGSGGKTQAGILKGKFGYMSPEQVRGVPIDRRSDVFSCGIVLYELLTGERLFVGESDFSTLEKVRNVEILPPSTYNRKIPDELERIVLKALAKDVEDRYQNAIDLHDELQAFVYTAGEFYSRKDLAGWMKKTFGKEIEEETAKLESYRQLKPPPTAQMEQTPAPELRPAAAPTKPPARKGTQPVPIAKPPPPPSTARSQPVQMVAAPEPMVAAPPPSDPVIAAPPILDGEAAPGLQIGSQLDPSAVGWEDDEVETQIYADQDQEQRSQPTRRPSMLPLQPPHPSSPVISLIAEPAGSLEVASDSLGPVPVAWDSPVERRSVSGGFPQAVPAQRGSGPIPQEFPAGSNNLPPPELHYEVASDPVPISSGREISAPSRLISTGETLIDPQFEPMAPFGARVVGSQRGVDRTNLLMLVAGGAAVAALTVVGVMLWKSRIAPPPPPPPVTRPVAVADPTTGFDLYVVPSGIMQWKLDGESRTDRLPSRIRGITPGPHTVQIDPPPGFLSQLQQVVIDQGKAPKVEIKLQPIPGISGEFESSPPGATVSLIVDGKRQVLGPSPASAPLDPRSAYQVLFEKPGYVSVNRPITFTGNLEERVIVNLEKAGSDKPAPPPPPEPRPHHAVRPPDRPNDRSSGAPIEPADSTAADSAGEAGKAKGEGVLTVGSKPPCEIYIDGNATGLRTPQKEIKVTAGRHRVTLVNSEYSIRDTFTVDVKADAIEKVIKDYTDKLPH